MSAELEDHINRLGALAAGTALGKLGLERLLIATPLYDVIPIEEHDVPELAALRGVGFQFDCYCVQCKKSSTFRRIAVNIPSSPTKDWAMKPGLFTTTMSCQRQQGHLMTFEFRLIGSNLVKYGQFPSLEDIAGGDIEKFRKQIPKYFGELRRATGLASHGIGIGAFVYLRRIFEHLLEEHRQEVESSQGAIDGYEAMRVEDKIKSLATSLPAAFVKNRAAYGILSKGLHELDEETCRKHFPLLRATIIQILEEDYVKRQAKEHSAALEKQIQELAAELKKG